jgi:hypothetical protein
VIPLVYDSNGQLRFKDGLVSDERRLRAYREGNERGRRERLLSEELHAQHMRLLADGADPTARRSGTRQVLHVAGDDDEEALWQAWRQHSAY